MRTIPVLMGPAATVEMVRAFLKADDECMVNISLCHPAVPGPGKPMLVAVRLEGLTFGFTPEELAQAVQHIADACELADANPHHVTDLGGLLAMLREALAASRGTSSHGPH